MRVASAEVTVGEALERAAGVLSAAGMRNARREAEDLYAALVLGGASTAWLDRERPAGPSLLERLKLAAERRASGMPQAYAAGRANFRGHWLVVDQRVLIPRPETEALVELVIDWTRRPSDHLPLVADIGTGSGCIAVSLALEASVAGVIATDLSAEALNVALHNAGLLGVRDRISLRRGDLTLALLDDRVDAVVSNPPYVATTEWEKLDRSVKDCEPRLALDGGPDGLGPTRRLVEEARGVLVPGGLLALEADAGRAEATAVLLRSAGFDRVEVKADLFERPRYVLGRQPEA